MQFKHPELLYTLLLLVIPIIVHLFQLRRFQKEAFTNVEFLKNVVLQTRKSSQLKKWLALLTRMLMFAAIILAFAQPYFSKSTDINVAAETVIYLDNSFSMQAKGSRGPLLQRSIQEIIESLDDKSELTVFTNDQSFSEVTRKTATNELINLNYSATQLDYNAAILKGVTFFSNNEASIKNLVLISDFQQDHGSIENITDDINLSLVKVAPINNSNVSVDSVYISNATSENIELKVIVKANQTNLDNLSVSLHNNDLLLAKSSLSDNSEASFTLPNGIVNGKITVDDANLNFDNTLYFNINQQEKINVLSINETNDNYLKRIYTSDEFNYNSVELSQLNYNNIGEQNLIILNGINNIPISLINAVDQFKNQGGLVLIIPSDNIDLNSYNQIFRNYTNFTLSEKSVTTINYAHPILSGVFEKQISNFQYPKVNSFYTLTSGQNILQFEDGKSFLSQQGNAYAFAASLSNENSNFINSPLIVPILYNIGKRSLQLPRLFYTIGMNNSFDVNTSLKQDEILKLHGNNTEIIPQQRNFNNKVSVNTEEMPDIAGIYAVIYDDSDIKNVSYNYSRKESDLNYIDISDIESVNVSDSVPQMMASIKNDTNVNELWKWFTIFALVLLIVEMLILKYLK
ncbi:BatA domain-containing protein [Flavobacteriaceae sp. LMIT009]